jgi:hypothetical protein
LVFDFDFSFVVTEWEEEEAEEKGEEEEEEAEEGKSGVCMSSHWRRNERAQAVFFTMKRPEFATPISTYSSSAVRSQHIHAQVS